MAQKIYKKNGKKIIYWLCLEKLHAGFYFFINIFFVAPHRLSKCLQQIFQFSSQICWSNFTLFELLKVVGCYFTIFHLFLFFVYFMIVYILYSTSRFWSILCVLRRRGIFGLDILFFNSWNKCCWICQMIYGKLRNLN